MIIKRINAFLNKGGQRSSLIKKNIFATFIIKGLSVLISLLYVPITLNYLNPTRYGIWMTLTSIVAWMSIFDIGLGNGLRNRLTEALALNDFQKGKKLVSTAYAMLTLIVIAVLILFFILNHWICWSSLLNTSHIYHEELQKLAVIVVTFFGIKFILSIVSTILIADQLPALSGLLEAISSGIGLIIIWILTLLNKTSLFTFGLAAMFTPVIVYFMASVIFFSRKYSFLKPSWNSIDLSQAKDLTGLGVQFFVIQIAVLVLFQTSNILIAHLFSPAEVTPYNIAFKYFSVLTMIWGILMTPLWSAFTQAKVVNDLTWIRRTIRRLNNLMIPTIIIILLMSFSARYIIKIWTDGQIMIQNQLVWIFSFYTLISIWNNIYAFFLNGVSKIKIQIYTSVVAAVIHIPLSFLFVRYCKLGSEGVVLSMAVSLSFFALAGPMQTFILLRKWKQNK